MKNSASLADTDRLLPPGGLWADLGRALPSMIAYEVGFRAVTTALAAPLAAWILQSLVARTGTPALSNTSIARFLLTPTGLVCGLLMVLGYFLGQLFLSAGLIPIAALARSGQRVSVLYGVRTAFRSSLKLFRVGLFQLVANAWLIAPFLGVAGLTFELFLSGHDINYYLAERPPSFYIAATIGGILAVTLLIFLGLFYVRTIFALPIALLENRSVWEAFKASRALVEPHLWRVAVWILGWHALVMTAAALVGRFYASGCSALLDYVGTRLILLVPLASALLLLNGILASVLSFAQVAGASFLSVELFDSLSGGRARAWAEGAEPATSGRLQFPRWAWRMGAIGTIISLAVTGVSLVRGLQTGREVTITAHRGSSIDAPENTLAAIRKSIEQGADYVEIDLHLTSEGIPILLHDGDLSRVAGIARSPNEFTLEELQKLDVGSWFSPAFAAERIPTLKQVIDLCRGRIKLNIELKPTGAEREPLALSVADLIRDEGFEGQSFVTSLDAKAVTLAHARNPKLHTGAIISAAVGDVTRLDVDVLSIRTGLVTGLLLGRAREAGKEVVAWTVDDPRVMGELIDQGVDGLITNDPATAIAIRRERQDLPTWQRVVLGFRSRLDGR